MYFRERLSFSDMITSLNRISSIFVDNEKYGCFFRHANLTRIYEQTSSNFIYLVTFTDIVDKLILKVTLFSNEDSIHTHHYCHSNTEEKILDKLLFLFLAQKTPSILIKIKYYECPYLSLHSYIKNSCGKVRNPHKTIAKMLVTEWANSYDLSYFIKLKCLKFTCNQLNLFFKVLFFQIIHTLTVIQKEYPGFRHNDLKMNNIFCSFTYPDMNFENYIPMIYDYNLYTFNNIEFAVPDIGITFLLGDFGMSEIVNLDRQIAVYNYNIVPMMERTHGVCHVRNDYYDLHYFFNTFLNEMDIFRHSPEHQDVFENYQKLIQHYIIPIGMIDNMTPHDKFRLLSRHYNFTTPQQLLFNLPLFDDFYNDHEKQHHFRNEWKN
jgi:hypothetical protein